MDGKNFIYPKGNSVFGILNYRGNVFICNDDIF